MGKFLLLFVQVFAFHISNTSVKRVLWDYLIDNSLLFRQYVSAAYTFTTSARNGLYVDQINCQLWISPPSFRVFKLHRCFTLFICLFTFHRFTLHSCIPDSSIFITFIYLFMYSHFVNGSHLLKWRSKYVK